MSVTRIFRASATLAFLLALAPISAAAAGKAKFTSPEAAYELGLSALKAGQPELAIPALEDAAAHGIFLAQFYLARLYADNAGAHTDHAKAYILYQRLSDEYADIDPDDDGRAPFVAKALTALAGYVKDGIPEIGLRPNVERAAEYLRYGATFFNDEDAQFEVAKLQLVGEGMAQDVNTAVHWLSVLTQKGHAGAQAFLADLYWRGKHVPKDPSRALALITLAAETAPPHERVWIEDIHQNIFCGAPDGVRRQAMGVVADWRRKYARSAQPVDRTGLSPLQPRAVRICGNGEPVEPLGQVDGPRSAGSEPLLAGGERPVVQGGAAGNFGLRDAGAVAPPRSQ